MPRTPRASRDAKRGHAAGRHRRWQSRSGLRKTSLDAVDIAHANASPSRYVATAMLCLGDMTVARANCDSRSRACGGVIIGPRAPCQIRSQATPPRHPPGRGGPGLGPGRGEIPEIRKFRKIPPPGRPGARAPKWAENRTRNRGPGSPEWAALRIPCTLYWLFDPPRRGPELGALWHPGTPPRGGFPRGDKKCTFFWVFNNSPSRDSLAPFFDPPRDPPFWPFWGSVWRSVLGLGEGECLWHT